MNIEDFNMFEPEELHPDLAAKLVRLSNFDAIQHPLVYSVPHSAIMNKIVNNRYVLVQKRLKQAAKEMDWKTCVWLHERPYRLQAFLIYSKNLQDPKDYWGLLGDIWIDTENFHQNYQDWIKCFRSTLPNREFCMTEEEREFLERLPDFVTAYRGAIKNKHGMSWTIDRDKALWFAKRFNKKGFVFEIAIEKKKIIAYFDRRNEYELLIDPGQVTMKEIVRVEQV